MLEIPQILTGIIIAISVGVLSTIWLWSSKYGRMAFETLAASGRATAAVALGAAALALTALLIQAVLIFLPPQPILLTPKQLTTIRDDNNTTFVPCDDANDTPIFGSCELAKPPDGYPAYVTPHELQNMTFEIPRKSLKMNGLSCNYGGEGQVWATATVYCASRLRIRLR